MTEQFFNSLAKDYSQKLNQGFLRHIRNIELKAILKTIQELKLQSVIDLGSGSGFYAKNLKEMKLNVTCVDQSLEMLRELSPKSYTLVHSKIEDLNIDQQFDLVLIAGSLEFNDNLAPIFQKGYQLTKPKGYCIILYPRMSIFSAVYSLFYRLRGIKLNIINKKMMNEHLKFNQFKILRRSRVFPLSYLIVATK